MSSNDFSDIRATTDPFEALELLTDLYAPYVGRFLISFGSIEQNLNSALSTALKLGLPHGPKTISQISNPITKASLIRSIVDGHRSDRKEETKQLVADLGPLYKLRNVVAHGAWAMYRDDGTTIVWMKQWYNRQNHKLEQREISIPELIDANEKSKALASLVWAINRD